MSTPSDISPDFPYASKFIEVLGVAPDLIGFGKSDKPDIENARRRVGSDRQQEQRTLVLGLLRRLEMRQEWIPESSRHAVRLLSISVATLLLCSVAMAEIDPNQIYLVLSTSKTTTLQKEIDEATPEGFRIVATASGGGGQVALMKRTASKGEDFGYRVLGTTKVDTMEKELNEAAAAGYCVLPGTMLTRKRAFGPPEIVAFVERGSVAVETLRVSRPGDIKDWQVGG